LKISEISKTISIYRTTFTRTMTLNQTPEEEPSLPAHFKDWPNSIGFDVHYEERSPVELRVEGRVPSYVSGTLFRTGSGPRTVQSNNGKDTIYSVNHWFDNFSQIHRFQIHPTQGEQKPRVTYSSRLLSDGIIEKVRTEGKLNGFTFGKRYDPCKSFFKKVQSVFHSDPPPEPNEVNVGVTITANHPGLSKTGKSIRGQQQSGLSTLMTKTDAQTFQMLDPETLEPIGIANQKTLHPELSGPMSAAHAAHDPVTGDVFNFNLNFGRSGVYKIWRTAASTGETSILATINHSPAYIHSLFLTEHSVVLCVWNSFFTMGGASILWNRNLMDAMRFDASKPAAWFVIDKKPLRDGGKGLVASYESDAMFCFHTINAFEETSADGSLDIVADLVGYENMDVLDSFYYQNMMSDSPEAKKWSENKTCRPTNRRYRLNIPATQTKQTMRAVRENLSNEHVAVELPTLAPSVITKKHRYIYGINDSGKSTFADSIVKHDLDTGTIQRWSKHGHTAGEAIFVPDPASMQEDGGVLLTVVLDGIEGKSYLLILDAKDLSEVGKAHVDGVVGIAFHGLYVGETADITPTARL
jgi:torulene dioxygenase